MELNALYADILRRLPPQQRQQLIVAERAWVAFKEKQAEFLHHLQKAGLLLEGTRDELMRTEVFNRINKLRALLALGGYRSFVGATDRESELNQRYQECIRKFSGESQRKLREAQRRWVTYREADSKIFPNDGLVIWNRISELRRFIEAANVPESTIPNPFERAK